MATLTPPALEQGEPDYRRFGHAVEDDAQDDRQSSSSRRSASALGALPISASHPVDHEIADEKGCSAGEQPSCNDGEAVCGLERVVD
jgi:hypothetical protein